MKYKKYITLVIGILFLIIGVFCIFIKSMSTEYIDSNNILHEDFFLIPIAFFFMLIGCIIIGIDAIKRIIILFKRK